MFASGSGAPPNGTTGLRSSDAAGASTRGSLSRPKPDQPAAGPVDLGPSLSCHDLEDPEAARGRVAPDALEDLRVDRARALDLLGRGSLAERVAVDLLEDVVVQAALVDLALFPLHPLALAFEATVVLDLEMPLRVDLPLLLVPGRDALELVAVARELHVDLVDLERRLVPRRVQDRADELARLGVPRELDEERLARVVAGLRDLRALPRALERSGVFARARRSGGEDDQRENRNDPSQLPDHPHAVSLPTVP
jgi:hypothetical protein